MDSAEFSLVQLTSAQFSSVQLSSAQFSSGLDWSVLVWSGLVWRGSVLNSLEQLEQFWTIRPISRTGWMRLEIVPVSEFLFFVKNNLFTYWGIPSLNYWTFGMTRCKINKNPNLPNLFLLLQINRCFQTLPFIIAYIFDTPPPRILFLGGGLFVQI